jgi:agmatinase
MTLTAHPVAFLDPPEGYADLEKARAVVVPFGYEGGVSYGVGTAAAPAAVLEASHQVEFYDDVLDAEPYVVGIGTLDTPDIPAVAEQMEALMFQLTDDLLQRRKFPLIIGGDHSITAGAIRAVAKHHECFGVIQLDAHADLRDSYNDSKLSHACAMARALDFTSHTLQIGIRSMDAGEAQRVRRQQLPMCTMRQWRRGEFDLQGALAALPDTVFLTIDVDVFDWSVIASTGTPEPGGFLWEETLDLLSAIFSRKNVIGCDVVELSYRRSDPNSPFAVAKLIYKIVGFKFADLLTAHKRQ